MTPLQKEVIQSIYSALRHLFFHWSDQLIMSIMSCLVVAHNFNILNGLTTKSLGNVKGKLNNVLMHMRKCVELRFNHLIWLTMHHRCLQHPYLYSQDIEPKGFSSEEEEHEKLIHGSAKLRLLKSLLPQLKERGHRVLLFSQVKNLPSFMVNGDIDEVPKVCDRTGYYRRFPTWREVQFFAFGRWFEAETDDRADPSSKDGSTKGTERQKGMDEFNRPGSDVFIYLLTTRAGVCFPLINLWTHADSAQGVGINLFVRFHFTV